MEFKNKTGALIILLFEAFITFFLVTFLVLMITQEFYLALLFGALASATAPAGTAAVFWEFDCKGPLTSTTMIILALDDVFAIILTDFAIDYASIHLGGSKFNLFNLFAPMLFDIGLSVLLGLIAGLLFSMSR